MVTWQQIGRGEPNPFDVTYTQSSTYNASYGELVITKGTQVDLPSPSENEAVGVRSFGQTVTITTPSGSIFDLGTSASFDSKRYIILVSDSTDWYPQNNEQSLS